MRGTTRIASAAVLLALGLGALPFFATPASAQEERVIRMVVGEQKTMNFAGAYSVSVGSPSVADVKALTADSFLLYAVGGGRTTLLVMRRGKSNLTFTVIVTQEDVKSLMTEVKKLLGDREGITIRPVGDRVILDGLAFTSDDFNRVTEITNLYPQVKSFVKVNPNAKKLVANQLNLAFKQSGLKDVEAQVVGTKIFLEGSVESKEEMQKAEMITKAIGEQVENLLTVGIKRMVLVEVDYVEVKKTGRDNIGISWPLDFDGTLTYNNQLLHTYLPSGSPTGTQTVSAIAGTTFGLGFIFTDGYGRYLAQPKLVCASGEKAEFHAGGEVPIPVVTANAIEIDFKKFGVLLNITPTADRHGNIQMSVMAEVSDLDDSIGITLNNITIPGFRVNKAQTNVTVRHGQTIVLSGLFWNAEEKNLSKVPGLGHIPIIGELFKSRLFQEKKSELTVFVTPRIVNPDTPKILKMISDIKSRYKRAKSEVGFGIFD
jgi:pilus assembly protein CpaC